MCALRGSQGTEEIVVPPGMGGPATEKKMARMRECAPLPMKLLSGLSFQVLQRLVAGIEELVRADKVGRQGRRGGREGRRENKRCTT